MRFHGNVNLKNNQLQESLMELVSSFPTAAVGKFVFRLDLAQAYLCISDAPAAWLPIGNKAAHVHNQIVPAMLWTVTHNFDSNDLFFEVYDSAGNVIIPDEITIVDANSITVSFGTSSVAGRVVIAALDGNAAQSLQVINDALQGSNTTWSSDKIAAEIAAGGGGGGGGTWGSITGTLSEQTDLQTALDAKAVMNDSVTNTTSTWSSSKISTVIAASSGGMDALYLMGGMGE